MGNQWFSMMAILDGPGTSPGRSRAQFRRRPSGRVLATGIERQPWIPDARHLSWQADASCTATDPEGFFPEGPANPAILNLCRACPVRVECLEYALDNPRLAGIWAATSEVQRARIRNRRKAARP